MIHLISEMPDPAAYGANDLTSLAEVNANIVYAKVSWLIRDKSKNILNILRRGYKEYNSTAKSHSIVSIQDTLVLSEESS